MVKNNQGKLVSVLSYITIVGWIIALILNQSKKTDLGRFHVRQALLIYVAGVVLSFIPVIGFIAGIILSILWIIGLVGAIQGKKKEVPIIGSYAQEWFKGL